ncbi:MAG: hypothetical protein AAFW47_08595 [Pseudomonadota bacterium]
MRQMNRTILAASALTLALTSFASVGQAAFGVSPLGQDPDQYVTIAEREQLQRLRDQGKIKTLYPFSTQRLRALEQDRWYQKQKKKRSK